MIFNNTKYTTWYYSIIDNAKKSNRSKLTGIYERHHIVPRSIGGNNKKDNLVLLSPREHFICHLLLRYMCIDSAHKSKMVYAAIFMAKTNTTITNSHIYENLKKQHIEILKDHWTEERREHQSNCAKKQIHSEQRKNAQSNRMKVFWSDKNQKLSRSKSISVSCKGRPAHNKGVPMTEEQKTLISKKNRKTYVLRAPDGKLTMINNMKKFCIENNLDYCNLHKLTRGVLKSYKKWTLP